MSVRVPRIELGSQPWEGRILPLNHTRKCARGGTRTHKVLRPEDFKSSVYTIPPPGHSSQQYYKHNCSGGLGRNRTADEAFAEPCLTTWLLGRTRYTLS